MGVIIVTSLMTNAESIRLLSARMYSIGVSREFFIKNANNRWALPRYGMEMLLTHADVVAIRNRSGNERLILYKHYDACFDTQLSQDDPLYQMDGFTPMRRVVYRTVKNADPVGLPIFPAQRVPDRKNLYDDLLPNVFQRLEPSRQQWNDLCDALAIPKEMGHQLLTPEECKCGEQFCNICEGGLSLCKVCGGAEASLPTDCPGVKMTSEQEEAVLKGDLNYVGGEWVNESNWPKAKKKKSP